MIASGATVRSSVAKALSGTWVAGVADVCAVLVWVIPVSEFCALVADEASAATAGT